MNEKKYNVIYMAGVEGNSVYLNDTRIAGPKPWGGGTIVKEWANAVSLDDIAHAIPEIRALTSERDEAVRALREIAVVAIEDSPVPLYAAAGAHAECVFIARAALDSLTTDKAAQAAGKDQS